MRYQIEKIHIPEPEARNLINDFIKKVSEQDVCQMDREGVEIIANSDDKKIDVYMIIEFFSEYEHGTEKCLNRSTKNRISMYDSETGCEIEFDCPISIEDEINDEFNIN